MADGSVEYLTMIYRIVAVSVGIIGVVAVVESNGIGAQRSGLALPGKRRASPALHSQHERRQGGGSGRS